MGEFISRKSAEGAVRDHWCDSSRMMEAIRRIPAADVAPVVHSHWIYKGKDKGYYCSICQSRCLLNYESDWCESDYCPHCGAKMDGGDSK